MGAAVLLAPFFSHNGIPAYIHDWSWPPDGAGLRAATIRGLAAWVPEGLGAPNAFPSILPQFYAEWLLSWFVPSKILLDLLLLATFALGIWGGSFAARSLFSVSLKWALACGLFYMAGPIVLVKFVAGHTSYLEGYASLPFFVGLALLPRIDNRRLWLALTALALAFSTVQLQLFGLELVILVAAVIFGKRTLKDGLTLACIALPLLIPPLLGPLILSQAAHGSMSMQRAVLSWQMEQSVPPLEALEGRGYFARYYELLTPLWLQHVLLLFPLGMLFALSQMKRELRMAALLAALAVVAWLAVTGLRGPLHDFWSLLFTHVAASSLYRELYDVMALYWLVCVLLATRFMASRPIAGAIFALFGLWALLPGWYNVSTLFGWAPSASLIARLDGIAQDLPDRRLLWWPAQQPIGPSNRRVGGADPLAYTPLAGEQPIFEYQPFGLFAAAVTRAQEGDWNGARPLLSQLGIGAVVERSDLVSFVSGRPQAASRVAADAGFKLVGRVGDFRLLRIVQSEPLLSLQDQTAFTQLPQPFEHSVVSDRPGRGRMVAAYPYYWMTPVIGLCGSSSVLGYRDDFLGAGKRWYFIAQFSSKQACNWIAPHTLARLPRAALLVAGGWSDQRPPAPMRVSEDMPASRVRVDRAWSDEWRGSFEASRPGLLVFRNDFDPRWSLSIDGRAAAARLVDGFANGWVVPSGLHSFALEFSPARYLRPILLASSLWLLILVVYSLGSLAGVKTFQRYGGFATSAGSTKNDAS